MLVDTGERVVAVHHTANGPAGLLASLHGSCTAARTQRVRAWSTQAVPLFLVALPPPARVHRSTARRPAHQATDGSCRGLSKTVSWAISPLERRRAPACSDRLYTGDGVDYLMDSADWDSLDACRWFYSTLHARPSPEAPSKATVLLVPPFPSSPAGSRPCRFACEER